MARINDSISIKNKINQELKKSRYEAFARNAAQTRFVAAKNQLMKDFDNDPVNQEILAGPTAEHSDFLAWGNLFAFIGFNVDSAPITELREFIDENIEMKQRAIFKVEPNKVTYNFPVQYPSLEDVYEATRMEKYTSEYPNNKSFVELVRGAINNTVGNFIFHVLGFGNHSRSTTGLQNKNADNAFNSFTASPNYIKNLLDTFKGKFKKA